MNDGAVWFWLVRVPCKPVFPRLPVSGIHAGWSRVCETGQSVSPVNLSEDGIIQGKVRYQTLQAGVFLLQLLKTLGLLYPHAAVLFAPAVIGAVTNPDSLPNNSKTVPLVEQYLRLTQFVEDLLWCVSSSGHLFPLFTIS
jgi:hypothetical protein